MTRFEQIGVGRQNNAMSTQDADRNFRHSCQVCCEKGFHICCDKCAIAAAHQTVVYVFGHSSA